MLMSGIKGGALLLVATVVLFAAGLGADGFFIYDSSPY